MLFLRKLQKLVYKRNTKEIVFLLLKYTTILLNFAYTIYKMRVLSKPDFGLLRAYLLYGNLIGLFVLFGFESEAKHERHNSKNFYESISVNIVGTLGLLLLFSICIFIIPSFLGFESISEKLVLILVVASIQFLLLFQSINVSLGLYQKDIVIQLIFLLLDVSFFLTYVWVSEQIDIVSYFLVRSLLCIVLNVVLNVRVICDVVSSINTSLFRSKEKFIRCINFVSLSLFGKLNRFIDPILVKFYLGIELFAEYSFLSQIRDVLLITGIYYSSIFVGQVDLNSDYKDVFGKLRIKSRNAYLLILILGFAGYTFLGSAIIPDYANLHLPMLIILLGGLFEVMAGSSGVLLMITGHARYSLLIQILTFLIGVFANWLFLWVFNLQLLGAALASVITICVLNVLRIYFCREKVGINIFHLLRKTDYFLLVFQLFLISFVLYRGIELI